MARLEYIIHYRTDSNGGRRFDQQGEGVQLEEQTLSEGERDDIWKDPRTRAIAASMPMKLIHATEQKEAHHPIPAACRAHYSFVRGGGLHLVFAGGDAFNVRKAEIVSNYMLTCKA
jgi:hypothetical protein